MKSTTQILDDAKRFCEKYLTCWANAMLADDKELLQSWACMSNSKSLKKWTTLHVNKVLYPLAETLHYHNYGTQIEKEYYRVDFSLYSWYRQSVWTLDYAIEHENQRFELNDYNWQDDDGNICLDNKIKYKGWFDEFAKLLPLKCKEARVIIGYDDYKHIDEKLKICHTLLNDKQIEYSLTDNPILLILFPSTKCIKELVNSESWNDDKQTADDNNLIRLALFYKDENAWALEPPTPFTNSVLQLNNQDEAIVSYLKKAYKLIAELKTPTQKPLCAREIITRKPHKLTPY